MHRRDFLRPQQLLQPAGQLLGALEELRALEQELNERQPAREAVLLRFGRRAMATTFEVLLPFGTERAQEHAEAALDLIDALESQLTVYREDSEVSRLNQRAHEQPVVVEERLFGLLALAQRLSEETQGAFDIAVGALVKAWGFYRRAGRVPTPGELAGVRPKIGMRFVKLDAAARTATFTRPGLEINLGSIGKGYALDRVVEHLAVEGSCRAALVHGGHSSIFALGSEPGTRRGWEIGIRHPETPERRLGILHLRNRGLATSAATYQHLEYQGRKLPHLLDPRTCWPAETMLQATATAPTAAEADALATAFFILGVEETRRYCERHPEVGAVLLPRGENARLVVLGRCLSEISRT